MNKEMMIVWYFNQPFTCVFQVDNKGPFSHQFYLGDDESDTKENINHKLSPLVMLELIRQVEEGRS